MLAPADDNSAWLPTPAPSDQGSGKCLLLQSRCRGGSGSGQLARLRALPEHRCPLPTPIMPASVRRNGSRNGSSRALLTRQPHRAVHREPTLVWPPRQLGPERGVEAVRDGGTVEQRLDLSRRIHDPESLGGEQRPEPEEPVYRHVHGPEVEVDDRDNGTADPDLGPAA